MKFNWKKLLISILSCQAVGLLGALVTIPAISSGWYATLVKPPFTPASSVFGPVWTFLYFLMGLSLYIIWVWYSKQDKKRKKHIPAVLTFFIFQLVLNFSWTMAFFGFQMPVLAALVIVALWICTAVLIVKSWKVSSMASLLLLPYLAWLSFAALLNLYIVILN